MSGPRGWVLFAVLFVLSVALRLFSLDSDPPRPITGGPNPNEGLYVQNARNEVAEGRWKLDEWNSTVIQPLGSALTALAFRSAGIGLRQARLVSVMLSLAAILLFFVLLKEASGMTTALLGTLLLATNGIFLIYSRQAGPAPLSILLMLTTILLWRIGKRHILFASLAGIVLVVAALVEDGSHNLFFIATAALATLMVRLQAWKMPWAPAVRRRVRAFWWAALMTLAVWVGLFVVPNRGDFARMLNTPMGSARWGDVAVNLFMAPFNFGALLRWSPVICIVSFIYFLIFARSLMAPIARHNPISESRVWFFAWLVTGPLVTAARSDRRLNVLVLLVPALCTAAAEALIFLLNVRRVRKPHFDILVVIGLLALFTWIIVQLGVHAAVMTGYRLIPRAFYLHQFRYEFVLVFGLAAPITWLLAYFWLRWKKFTFDMSPRAVSGVFAVLLAAMLFTSGLVARSIFHARRDVVAATAQIAELPAGSVVAGSWGPLVALDSRHRGMVLWWGEINGESDAMRRNGVTHLLLQRGSREDLGVNPVFRNQAHPVQTRWIRSMPMGRYELDLYALLPEPPLTGRSDLRRP